MASRRHRHGPSPPGGRRGRPPPHGPREPGVKRRLVVEADGGLLGATMAGAHVHDTKRLAATLGASVVVECPQPTEERPQHLCLDTGGDQPTGHETVAAYQSPPYPAHRGGKRAIPTARRPLQCAAGSWNGRWPGSPSAGACPSGMRNKAVNVLGLLQRACALIWRRRRARLISD
jgi:hypothetical protein